LALAEVLALVESDSQPGIVALEGPGAGERLGPEAALFFLARTFRRACRPPSPDKVIKRLERLARGRLVRGRCRRAYQEKSRCEQTAHLRHSWAMPENEILCRPVCRPSANPVNKTRRHGFANPSSCTFSSGFGSTELLTFYRPRCRTGGSLLLEQVADFRE